jgi:hypothetical protein
MQGHSRLMAMGLNETHFDTVTGVLVGTLLSMGVPQRELDDVVDVIVPLRGMFKNERSLGTS